MSLREQKFVLRPINFFGAMLIGATVLSGMYMHSIGSANEDYEFTLNFSRGTSVDPRDMPKIEIIADLASTNAAYTIVVTGHTGTSGDSAANVELSKRRASAIEALLLKAGVNNKIKTIGVGGDKPLNKSNGESNRDFQSRLSRAVVSVESDL